jgi:hypothetical protein
MSDSALFYVAFFGVVVMILLTVWVAMVFEAGQHPPESNREAAEPGEANAPERKAA